MGMTSCRNAPSRALVHRKSAQCASVVAVGPRWPTIGAQIWQGDNESTDSSHSLDISGLAASVSLRPCQGQASGHFWSPGGHPEVVLVCLYFALSLFRTIPRSLHRCRRA